MRNQLVQVGENQVLFDCYNANPASMKAAVDSLSGLNAKRKIAVLGDMLELGVFADMYHEQIGREISKSNVDILITAGELSKAMHKSASYKEGIQTIACDTTETATEELLKNLQPCDAVLLKASRGLHFESIFEKLNENLTNLENKKS